MTSPFVPPQTFNGLLYTRNHCSALGLLSLKQGSDICMTSCVTPTFGRISPASGRALFSSLIDRGLPVRCFKCGIEALSWIIEKDNHNKAQKFPMLNLFAVVEKSRWEMMTQDHIIPKSEGGLNLLENLRPACARCNHNRKSKMTEEELQFKETNTHLWNKKVLK